MKKLLATTVAALLLTGVSVGSSVAPAAAAPYHSHHSYHSRHHHPHLVCGTHWHHHHKVRVCYLVR
jgi:hypothetical protein